MAKKRLDQLVAERGLAASVEEARRFIMAGEIFSGTERLSKPGVAFREDTPLEARRPSPWVGRGALKLLGALEAWPDIAVKGRACVDAGSSTGGFTQVLIERGARTVWAVDSGKGQLHPKLRNDPRVRVREETNARSLPEDFFDEAPPSLLVADLSFISLKAVLPRVLGLLRPEEGFPSPEAAVLMKPQFEAAREQVERGGVVRDPEVHRALVEEFAAWAPLPGWKALAWMESPERGASAGNVEYLFRYGAGSGSQ